ncbi:MAG: hypothetical protein HYS36_08865 [Candidatus Rokubacteria bacterium]|nr:hypothetical protein [Candidatus Rokubacteria bacterium]
MKRLAADYERVRLAFPAGSPISIKEVYGRPPEKYHVRFEVAGLAVKGGKILPEKEHLVEVYLPAAYPRMSPQCRMLTPVFHPNIAPHAICIGDHWAAGESLVELLVRIAEMLSFQSYNIKSPLNGEAARWAEQHAGELPTDRRDFSFRDVGPAKHTAVCLNCGSTDGVESCGFGHAACPDCRAPCGTCGKSTCLRCARRTCAVCRAEGCPGCSATCANCTLGLCAKHRADCKVCRKPHCGDCMVPCPTCSASVCLRDYDGAAGRCRPCASAGVAESR